MHLRRIVAVACASACALIVCWYAAPLYGCSAVLLTPNSHPVMARSYDWHIGEALLMVNQPGIAKRALAFDNPAEWVSKYGSVTINQYGREMPCEGMNQAGVAIAVLWLDESQYPVSDHRPSVTSAQWVQYQLDTAGSVADVVASDSGIRITPLGGAKVHYFVSDASGDCAVIEFLEGRMVVHRGEALPHPLITNDTCAASQQSLADFEGFGGQQPMPSDRSQVSRYVRLAAESTELVDHAGAFPGKAFDTIDSVRQPHTQWQVVYDLAERRVHFRTQGHHPSRFLDLDDCQFDSSHRVQVLDIAAPLAGDVQGELRDYSPAVNRRLVQRNFAATHFTRKLPMALVNLVTEYPEHACRVAAPSETLAR